MEIAARHHVSVSGLAGGQPMVFSHGFGCDQCMWRLVAPAFEDDFNVVLFDHVGAGRSDLHSYDPEKYASLEGYAADVIEVCRELELESVIFVGHSVSAMIGVLACQEAPELFDKLVLVGPSARYVDDGEYRGGFTRDDIDELLGAMENNHLGWSRQMAPVIMANPDHPELGQELTESFCRTDPSIAAQFARVTFLSDNRRDLHRLDLPTLVLQCRDDVIAPEPAGEFVRDAIDGSTYVLLDASGHCPQLSAPEATIDAIASFVRRS